MTPYTAHLPIGAEWVPVNHRAGTFAIRLDVYPSLRESHVRAGHTIRRVGGAFADVPKRETLEQMAKDWGD